MRYLLAAIFVCALGMPAASALPAAGAADALVLTKASPIEQIGKRAAKPRAKRSKSGGDGGIHPLVGSGGY